MTGRTILIGLDGATWTILHALMADGTMPFLRDFVRGGVRAPLRTIVPALTPPAWTSLVTGRSPGHHGIFNFFGMEPSRNHTLRLLGSPDVGAPTLWSIVNRERRRATVLNFPLTFPAPAIDGNVVAGGWMPWRQLRLGCYPAALYDQLKTLPGWNPRELAMDMAHEEKALEGCAEEEYRDWIDLHIRREHHWFGVLDHLMEHDPTDLTAILFDGVDKLQHLCWRFIDPALAASLQSPWEHEVRAAVLRYFRELDGLLARIVQRAGSDATVVMASDHGFGAQRRTFFVNQWLAEQGWLHWADGVGPRAASDGALGMKEVARHVYLMDWERTVAYAAMPGGNGIHLVADRHADARSYERLREEIVARLHEVRDPQTGEAVVGHVWRREEVFEGPFMASAPDLTLELSDGGLFSILSAAESVVPRPQPTGTHAPVGMFAASGPGIARGARVDELSILDVAPLLLWSMDVPIPADLEGALPVAALDAEALAARPPRRGDAGTDRAIEPNEAVLDEQDELELMRRLRALGYVE